jgi:hypothetical protein
LLFIDDDVVAAEGTARRHLAHHAASPRPLVLVGYMPCVIPKPRRRGQFPIYLYQRSYEGICRKYEADASSVLRHLWGGHVSVRRSSFSAISAVPPNFPRHQDRVLGWYLLASGCAGVFDRSLRSEHRFERSPAQFFADCRKSGQSQVALASASASPPLHLLNSVMEAERPHVVLGTVLRSRAVLGALRVGIAVSGRLHLWQLETLFARAAAFGEICWGTYYATR